MKVVFENPPNIGRIRQFLNPPKGVVYAYNPSIYNPDSIDMWPDLEEHEKVHFKQQGNDPDFWWERYLQDPQFRLEQEVEAYAHQLNYFKEKGANNKELKDLLFEFAKALTSMYNLDITYQEAENKIRRYNGRTETN